MKRVEEIMDSNPITVSPSATLIEVARKMTEHKLAMIPVCENGKLRGVISEGDIISSIGTSSQNPKRREARSLMHNSLPKVSPGADTFSAAKLMARHQVHYLPVVQNGRFKGILTLDHLVGDSLATASLVLDRTQHQCNGAAAIPAGT
ncbi:MAG: CBS domain-containing protein [Dehalococcoidia bacterium]